MWPVRMHRLLLALVVAAVASGVPAAYAQTWQVVPSISLESTLTDNVNLAPSDQRRSDWINQITPALGFSETGRHTKLSGSVSLPMLVYARTSNNNYIAPNAAVSGTLEAIDNFLFVDASANVSQQYLNPFGARPNNLANATQNRYTAQLYTFSPYIKGLVSEGTDYELRQTSTWSNATGVSAGTTANGSYTNDITAHLAQEPRPGGWRLEYARSDIRFRGLDALTGQNRESTEIARGYLTYAPDPTWQVAAIGGYEDNQFFQTHESGAVYGASAQWRPDDRTTLSARAEHRFFGTGYSASFDHHTPLTVWSFKASRDAASYPQQLATLPGGANVDALLNALFASRVQDPAQRQALVDQVIRDRGLPSSLAGPLALYAQQITLVDSQTGTFGILGARNSIFFTAYRTRNEPVVASQDQALSPLLTQLIRTTQVGGNVVWTHQLAGNLTLGTNAGWARITDDSATGGATRQYTLNAIVSSALSPLTSVHAGLRYQDSQSDVATGYREFAIFVGLTHTFR